MSTGIAKKSRGNQALLYPASGWQRIMIGFLLSVVVVLANVASTVCAVQSLCRRLAVGAKHNSRLGEAGYAGAYHKKEPATAGVA